MLLMACMTFLNFEVNFELTLFVDFDVSFGHYYHIIYFYIPICCN